MISKNGLPQVEAVIDQISKSLKVETKADTTTKPADDKSTKEKKKKNMIVEYILIIALVLLIAAVGLLALNRFGIIKLPITFPISWLNRDFALLFLKV